jgi:hypothetical protein
MDMKVDEAPLGTTKARKSAKAEKGDALIAAKVKGGEKIERVSITPPNFKTAAIRIRGSAPLVIHAFSAKSQAMMEEQQQLGEQAKKGRKREPKDFTALYNRARHISRQGWDGIPAAAFRNALISACRVVGFKMTIAKLSLFVLADGFDRESGQPLVKITKGKPREHRSAARNASGVIDIRARPMWEEGWEAIVRVKWDGDQFQPSDVVNLFARVGGQVGICEGRPDSAMSAGCGWGTFEVVSG